LTRFGPIHQKALVAAAGYNPLALPEETLPVEAWAQAWAQALVAGYIAHLLEPILFLPQLIDLARSAAKAEAEGLDHSVYDAQALALIAHRE
jgi:hypothetical protein